MTSHESAEEVVVVTQEAVDELFLPYVISKAPFDDGNV